MKYTQHHRESKELYKNYKDSINSIVKDDFTHEIGNEINFKYKIHSSEGVNDILFKRELFIFDEKELHDYVMNEMLKYGLPKIKKCMYCEKTLTEIEAIVLCKECTE